MVARHTRVVPRQFSGAVRLGGVDLCAHACMCLRPARRPTYDLVESRNCGMLMARASRPDAILRGGAPCAPFIYSHPRPARHRSCMLMSAGEAYCRVSRCWAAVGLACLPAADPERGAVAMPVLESDVYMRGRKFVCSGGKLRPVASNRCATAHRRALCPAFPSTRPRVSPHLPIDRAAPHAPMGMQS